MTNSTDQTLREQYLSMSDANRFLMDHCTQIMQGWNRELRGINHAVNRCLADYADCWEVVKELKERTESQSKALSDAIISIGKLEKHIEEIELSLKKARQAYTELKNRNVIQGRES